ncbi:hypothetical protein NYE48_28025 [Paenibacillus sp. FSL M7-1455]|uniref:hypothetical protein n=1 Tax=Paenibacillus sp. FSL M7-1455 TaxID=2975316 RepID=UPI0030F5451E
MTRETATYTCPQCRRQIRVLADEIGDHPCSCGWDPEYENEGDGEDMEMNIIEKLRELIGDEYEGQAWDEVHEEVDAILDTYHPRGYSVECVDEEFEDGGRWTNYKTNVYRVEQDGQVAYFSIWREVPATECQDGGDFMVAIEEVVPEEVIVTKYVPGRAA